MHKSAVLLWLVFATIAAASPDAREVSAAKKIASYCRGLEFKSDLPVEVLTSNKLAEILTQEFKEEFAGDRLAGFQELYGRWLGLLPEGFDLEAGMRALMQEQVAGLYDNKTKTMYVAEETKKSGLDTQSNEDGNVELDIVLCHEFHHALEDQHFDFTAMEKRLEGDDDGSSAMQCVMEGTATRGIVEAMPTILASQGRSSVDASTFFAADNFIRLPVVESALMGVMHDPSMILDSAELKAATNMPAVLFREMVQPYLYGYRFARTFSRDYGNDGLNRLFTHLPVSTEQILHSDKYWAWRDLPVQISLPTNAPGGWQLWSNETIGEADVRTFFDHHLGDGGVAPGLGWDGGRVGLYRGPDGKRLFAWSTAWDSGHAARRFEKYARKVWLSKLGCTACGDAAPWQWRRPDGRVGLVARQGTRVVVMETDAPAAWSAQRLADLRASITYKTPVDEPPQGPGLVRSNPALAYRRDADYVTVAALAGILYRHDGNAVGTRDQVLGGWILRLARSRNWREFTLAHGWLVRHRADSGRDYGSTTILPWGILWSDAQTRNPLKAAESLRQNSIGWGWVSSYRRDDGRLAYRLLPWGVLLRHDRESGKGEVRNSLLWGLLTSYCREKEDRTFCLLPWGTLFRYHSDANTSKARILGIPVYWSSKAESE